MFSLSLQIDSKDIWWNRRIELQPGIPNGLEHNDLYRVSERNTRFDVKAVEIRANPNRNLGESLKEFGEDIETE